MGCPANAVATADTTACECDEGYEPGCAGDDPNWEDMGDGSGQTCSMFEPGGFSEGYCVAYGDQPGGWCEGFCTAACTSCCVTCAAECAAAGVDTGACTACEAGECLNEIRALL